MQHNYRENFPFIPLELALDWMMDGLLVGIEGAAEDAPTAWDKTMWFAPTGGIPRRLGRDGVVHRAVRSSSGFRWRGRRARR